MTIECSIGKINVRRASGLYDTRDAWLHGDFGVVQSGARFVIVHRQSGVALSGKDWGSFSDLNAAIDAMVQLQKLRPDWSRQTWETMQAGGHLIKEIIRKFGGQGQTKGRAPHDLKGR